MFDHMGDRHFRPITGRTPTLNSLMRPDPFYGAHRSHEVIAQISASQHKPNK